MNVLKNKMKYLITGTAGFIGFHLAKQLLERGDRVVGLDNINDYYDVNLKFGRLKDSGIDKEEIKDHELVQSKKYEGYSFVKADLSEKAFLFELFQKEQFDVVVNLAAQAGVRYSLINPDAYIDANITGFLNILEACRAFPVNHLVYASSSSVYGANTKMPFSTSDNVDHPLSLYAASKKSNELMAHTYSHLFKIPTTGLRFFTVYGPWGRPDMALFLFIEAMKKGEPIQVFNHGKMKRDFTYVEDIVEGIIRVADRPPKGNPEWNGNKPDPGSSYAPFKVYNIGNSSPVELMDYIGALEKALGIEAKKELLPLQPGDVPATFADVSDLMRDTGYKPNTPVEVGVARFVEWYNTYYGN
ncbi:UDP-glucuronate 4-epimerase [Cecembia calidifontis]|uniref:UDP-glucuronate 4-epimerase n=2 Tax=Cecembia calidifontis TaxID=1187080 RepID=A0A4Q7PD35_9BACT|nr:UDP-glucuronate 4-epimerase [Cecembia calidifontis]